MHWMKEASENFINFIWSDHECKILYMYIANELTYTGIYS